jgi:hypothetical protein
MTNQQHPITPPPDLVEQWLKEFYGAKLEYVAEASIHLAARAAQWGGDKELKACCEWLHDTCVEDPEDIVPELRAARRPKPLSLKEQALETLQRIRKDGYPCNFQEDSDWDTIRRALEALLDD